jgi:hypothetical protein
MDLTNTILCDIYYFTIMTVFGFVGFNTEINELKIAAVIGFLNTICYSIDVIVIRRGWMLARPPLPEYEELE